MLKIPFNKPSINEDEIDEVVATLRSGWLTTGPKTKQFERDFAEYLKQKHAIAVNSCTAALHLALEAIGLKKGQAVVVPTMTFAATAGVVHHSNAIPLLTDCRKEDFNLDVADAERKIEAALARGLSVSAIMPMHYGGQVGDFDGVHRLAARYKLKIIEDAAHCCPAHFRATESEPWRSVGATADISCYSFYANKCITTGEGGMACTHNDEFANRIRIMCLHGISKDAWKRFTAEGSWYYEITAPGFKYNMTDIAAAIGIHQLRKANEMHRKRTQWAELYSKLLGEVEELILPQPQPNRIHSWHLYVIRLKLHRLKIDRAEFITKLQQRGIGLSVHWMPLHMHPYYKETYGYRPDDLPVASSLYPEIVTLPLYPDMTEGDVAYVVGSIKEILASNRRLDLKPHQS